MNWSSIRRGIFLIPRILEIIIGVVISVVICFSVVGMISQTTLDQLMGEGALFLFLQRITEVIISIELVKIIFSHTLDATLEIIIMAIVRQIITDHLQSIDTLIFVLAIAVLFVVRKYFFIKKLDRMADGDEADEKYFAFWKKRKNEKKAASSAEKISSEHE